MKTTTEQLIDRIEATLERRPDNDASLMQALLTAHLVLRAAHLTEELRMLRQAIEERF